MIFCFDLDGTLCSHDKQGKYERAIPYKFRIMRVNKLYKQGHTIIIETARGTNTKKDWRKLTSDQLKKWGVKYHKLRTGTKFFADAYIDDKGVNDKDFFAS